MIATSVAGRGLDVKNLVLVVNYNCPNHLEDYIHRCEPPPSFLLMDRGPSVARVSTRAYELEKESCDACALFLMVF